MSDLILPTGWIAWILGCLFLVLFIATSLVERRLRAARTACLVAGPPLILFALLLIWDTPLRSDLILILLVAGLAAVILVVAPVRQNEGLRIRGPQEKVDERDAIFHRFYRLEPGSADFKTFYRQHPEKRSIDDEIRNMPPLGMPGSKSYHPAASLFQAATFDTTERLTRRIEWPAERITEKPVTASTEELTLRIKGFARYAGADLVGATRLNPAYIYSHIGRSPGTWGDPVSLDHTHAIAIGIKMDHNMIRHAPDVITTTESSFAYLEAAKIALMVARYINFLGYNARAHVDGNYRVLCGPIAADAGLGELGRLGLLITPQFGPRVRLSVVTTDLPLQQDDPIAFGVQDFCTFCKKCADNCPSGAIASGDKQTVKGVEKWQSDQEKCYRFWRQVGSDCSICIKVCPYSHPGSPLHQMVRWAIRRNHPIRRLALAGDDLFYGRRPKTRYPLPAWHATD